jgi:exo-1,4-beta-D-glucosaminidase
MPITSWQLAPASVTADGALISSPAFDANATSWMAAVAPHGGVTLLAALAQSGQVTAPLYGDNLGALSAHWGARFGGPWWYRASFTLPPGVQGSYGELLLDGVNYRANVWLNGKRIADNRSVVGAYRTFALRPSGGAAWSWGGRNTIALECFRQHDELNDPDSHDLGISFLDWAQGLDHGQAPDGSLGVWRKAAVAVGGAVALRAPQLSTRLTADGGALLTLSIDLSNSAPSVVSGTLDAVLGDVTLARFVVAAAVPAGGTLPLSINATIARVSDSLLWWPHQMGAPRLHNLSLSFTPNDEEAGGPPAALAVRVGLREMSGGLDERGNFLLRVNGRRLLVRGAGWTPDLLQRMSGERNELELHLVRHARLNAVRFEGKLQDDDLFDRMDELGLLALPGLSCCDAWQQWSDWTPEEHTVAAASLADQLRRLRRHPSLGMFLLSSDELPPPAVEAAFLKVAADAHLDVPIVAAASWRHSTISGSTGVKMAGPYAWVPPTFWLDPRARTPEQGGAWGFATEISPGTSPLSLASAVAAAPGAVEWPLNFSARHTAEPAFQRSMAHFRTALSHRYGNVSSSRAFFALGQIAALEAHRAMFEAYSAQKYEATGLVQWMLNSAYLSNSWHLYDHRLSAGGALYGVRSACAPLAAQYNALNGSVALVNSLYRELQNVTVTAKVYALGGGRLVRSSQAVLAVVASDGVVHDTLPPPRLLEDEPTLLRLRASAAGAGGGFLSEYVLPPRPDAINFTAGCGNAGCTDVAFADLRAVTRLPRVAITASATFAPIDAGGTAVTAVVEAASDAPAVALGVELRLMYTDPITLRTAELLPVLWDDNYFSLLPGERRTVGATLPLGTAARAGGDDPILVVESLNAALGSVY